MSEWLLGGQLTAALAIGFAVGWLLCARFGVRSPNVWVSAAILLTGSLGAPVFTGLVLGQSALSFTVAVFLAGFSTGAVFWPMSLPQGVRRWL